MAQKLSRLLGLVWFRHFSNVPYLNNHVNLCISTSLCSPTDVPPPTAGSVSVVALNETGKVRVTWSRPTLGPGQVITGYSVQYRRRGSTSYTTRSVSDSSAPSYTITNLTLGAVYEVRVASVGHLGQSGYCCGNGKQVTTYNRECINVVSSGKCQSMHLT